MNFKHTVVLLTSLLFGTAHFLFGQTPLTELKQPPHCAADEIREELFRQNPELKAKQIAMC